MGTTRGMRGAAAVALTAAVLIGCGDRKDRGGHDQQAVGTSGRSAATVAAVFTDGTPAFVGRDAEGVRLWKLTRQFYQKRDDAFAWIAGAAGLLIVLWSAAHAERAARRAPA